MRQMPKPEVLVFKNDNQFEVSGRGVADAETYAVAVSEKLSAGFSSLFASSGGSAPPGDADLEKGVAKDADGSATSGPIREAKDACSGERNSGAARDRHCGAPRPRHSNAPGCCSFGCFAKKFSPAKKR